jgi:exonuclease SbcC
MKLSGFLNKPRWQSKEPAVRRAGVAGDEDAELLANLVDIARQDVDPGVRGAAMKRLADPGLTQRLAQEDPDPGVRADARKLWFDLLAGTHARSPTAVECTRLLRAQDDVALIEHIARTAADLSLRGAALSRVTRTTLLADRVTADPSPELRLAALERIDDEALLERIAERTRKTDKRISRGARVRADALRIARGNSDVAETLARSLCERIERLVREPQGVEAESELHVQWTAIEARAGDQLRTRYRAAQQLLSVSREARATATTPATGEPASVADDGVVANAEAPVADSETVPEPAAPEAETIPAQSADPLLAQARFAASLSAASAERIKDQEQKNEKTQHLENAVSAFESAVEEGVVARAHAAHAELAALRKSGGAPLSRALQRRLADAEHRYAELSQWQHWSDNQRRRQLCESIEELIGSGLHPDAIATRVREAQAEWSRLDAAEGHVPSGHAVHGWARRFHSACRHALEPAKSYFKKRQELRKTHAQTIAASLEQARAIPEDCSDWPLVAKVRHAIVDSLRTLDQVDPHERKALAKGLKSALNALDARVTGHHAEVESAKSTLIAEAQALTSGEMPRGAVAAARALQQRWREVGNGRRDRDQAQWKAFRTALDAVFGKLDAERSERSARDADSRSRAGALCTEFENLAKAEALPTRAEISRVSAEWDALNVRDESLLRRFRAAQAILRDVDIRRERVGRRNPYDAWLARYRLCRAAERAEQPPDDLRTAWEAAPRGEVATSALASRFETALQDASGDATPASNGDVDEDALREVLIRIEIFAGLESPREDQERRRKLQIERLSARMRGAAALTPHQELAALLSRWTELAGAESSEFDARLERDLAAAIETLP